MEATLQTRNSIKSADDSLPVAGDLVSFAVVDLKTGIDLFSGVETPLRMIAVLGSRSTTT